jgi:hypothetical protein
MSSNMSNTSKLNKHEQKHEHLTNMSSSFLWRKCLPQGITTVLQHKEYAVALRNLHNDEREDD